MKILILGGYGVFGGRLAHLLADLPQVSLLIAGRDEVKAQQFCADFSGETKALPIHLDRREILQGLARLEPDLVVDASGPFQDYGAEQYGVVQACIEAKVDYLDFADGADFVFGISQFDDAAKNAGIFVLSGVSSFPVLTAAVLREISKSMEVVEVQGGIAPSPYAGIGLNVMRAVIGYAGAPVTLTRGGKRTSAVGLAESLRYTVAVPGRLPLRNIRFSLVDVPDLQVIPPEHSALTEIWMGAGPVPEVLHLLLNVLAKVRHYLRLPSLAPFAGLFYTVLNLMKFGEHRGGMFVHVRGLRNGKQVERSWHLLAEADDGPFIPSMAIEAIIRKLVAGRRPASGARPATHALELSDYDQAFAGKTIYAAFREDRPDAPIYQQILGDAFYSLPPQVKALHASTAKRIWVGTSRVERGNGILSLLIGAVIGFPKSADSVAVEVTFEPDADGELWTRRFGEQKFHSHQRMGRGRNEHLIVERFGIVDIALALVIDGERLKLMPRRWSILGLPMPKALLPKGDSFETEKDGQFCFDVTITIPFIGHIASYRGSLSECEMASDPSAFV